MAPVPRCRAHRLRRRRLVDRVPAASDAVAVEGKTTVLVAGKLGAAGLALLWEFANVDCSYDLSPEGLRAKISLCDALVVRSGTNVGSDVFEASGVRLRIVGRVVVGIGIGNGYLVVNAPIANTVTAAEDGIALMCAMARNAPRPTHRADVRHGQERRQAACE
ncbi:D-3-phosphoglycerate dehydrogenase 1, chloroplastic-like [Hordeum vulgare]|nr:D-3-phosphoglycerate dehydrogenase 1, chloroplastic-like [Hordeum vulgare]